MKAKTSQTPQAARASQVPSASAALILPRRLSLVDQTVRSLRDGISSGHWQSHLPGERELCEYLQIGRNTLRAALQELERSGWLEVLHGQRRRIIPQPAGARARPG